MHEHPQGTGYLLTNTTHRRVCRLPCSKTRVAPNSLHRGKDLRIARDMSAMQWRPVAETNLHSQWNIVSLYAFARAPMSAPSDDSTLSPGGLNVIPPRVYLVSPSGNSLADCSTVV